MGFQRFLPGVFGAGGSGINLPDDHIFATTEARDAAIPSPKEGEQCAVQSGEPQYHLLQEYRTDQWVDITYVIRGPKGDKGDSGGGSNVDPAKGFTLDKNAAIKTQMPNGDHVDVILADDLKDLLIGNSQQCMQLTTACNGIYVQYDEGAGKILLDDEGAPGIKLKPITDAAYCSFDYQGWATIITDNSAGDICYFVQAFKGALFSGLPASISLDPDTDYVIASEVTQRKGSAGFAHRLSIISANQEDDANNRTLQRAGSNFDHAKSKWSEVMLKRDAVVFDDMAVSTPQVFSTIIAGENMSGEVVDGVLTLSSTGGGGGDTFDTVTTRLMRVHESPESSDKYTEWSVDENFNTEVYAIGDTHYYRKDPDSGDLTEIYQIDSTNRFVVKTKIKTPVITNLSSGSTNSNSEKSAYIDLSKDNKVNIGAYDSVNITVAGEKVRFGQGTISFDDTGEGYITNLGLIARNSSNETNSIRLNDGNITHTTDIHSFKLPDGTELCNFNKDFINFKNHNLKFVRHLVGNTPGTMYVANVNMIKRDDAENNKNSITLNDGSMIVATNKFEVKNNDGARRLTVENDGISFHDRKLQELADGEDETDAATIGQLNAATGIPYLRKFDSTGGDIRAMNYPENRVQAWINYKGDGVSEVSIDSMRNNDSQQFDQIALDNQSQNVCKLRLFYNGASVLKRVLPGEIIQCWTSREFARWKWIYGSEDSPTSSTSFAIEENNDEIITPNKGEQFQLTDSSKTASYGNDNKQVTYFAPNVGTQSDFLLTKLEYSKVFAIHEEVNSTKLIMIIHESLVAEIYNRDVTDVNELTMLFTGDSRGRLAKSNQRADEQFAINWNGELIPADDDPNELNPTHWVASDDSVTETWSNSVKSVCYSSGVLANRGSAALRRGDVVYSKPESVTHDDSELLETPKHLSVGLSDSGETATITYDDNSEFFVMPIVAGGGSFSVMKVFQLFMGRKTQVVENWGSLKFDKSSDCIGTILKIAYDAAIAEEERAEEIQNSIKMELFKMAVESQNKYGTQLVVDLRGEEDAS